MHHQANTFRVDISIQSFGVETRIKGGEDIKNIVLGLSEPVFPSYISSFNEHLLETVLERFPDLFEFGAFHIRNFKTIIK